MPQYELNLRDYLRIFRKRRFTILAVFLLVTVSSMIFLSLQPAVYKADVTIKIEERKTIAGLLTEWIMYNPADVMESHTKIIKGYPVMKSVAERLGLLSSQAPVQKVNEVVNQLQADIDTERVSQTNMIKITATSSNAKQAMDMANSVAEVYIEESLQEKAKQARHVRQFIEDQLSALETRLKDAEERLRRFGEDAKTVKLADPIQRKLVDLEFQLAELLQKYTEKHPLVIQVKAQIQAMEQQVNSVSEQELEYSRINREIEVNKKLYGMLKEKLEEARISEAQKIGDISVVNPAFLPEAPVSGNRNLKILLGALMGLLLGFAFAFIFETLDTSISTIEDVENVVKLPILGVIPSIEDDLTGAKGVISRLIERFKPLSSQSPAEERLIRLIAHYKPHSSVAEAYRNVNTNLNLKADSEKKAILVTSSGAREGKSTVVANLGIVLAQTGLKTLLVSADLRRPVLAKAFGVNREPGLSELLDGSLRPDEACNSIADIIVGDMSLDDVRITPGLENISIISSGKLPFNPVKLLGSKELPLLIQELKQKFDVIIFDSPPVLPVTDASLIAPKMDCVVIVYEIGRTSREALIRSKIQLESVGAKIAGVILNNTQPRSETMALYPYYSRHRYRYYNTEEDEKKAGQKRHTEGT